MSQNQNEKGPRGQKPKTDCNSDFTSALPVQLLKKKNTGLPWWRSG